MRTKLFLSLFTFAAILVAATTPAGAHGRHRESPRGNDGGTSISRQLAEVRRATAPYRDIEHAIQDGYELGYNGVVTGCIAHPTDGAMGYHYFNAELMDDPQVDPLRPEGLLYAPSRNGKLRLVAVEWVVPPNVWAATGDAGSPSVLDIDLHVLNPALGWYIHHAWIWKHNPSGVFADWNPRVECPQ